MERAEWQVAGIARTLVDAIEGATWTPRPAAGWLARYADVLDEVGAAIEDFGVRGDEDARDVDEHVERALTMLRALSDEVRDTRLDDPAAWPAYGALVLDAERLAHDLRDRHPGASVPTDSGPLRVPFADALPPTVTPTAPPSP